jgi:hypothetical protein
MRPDHDHEIDTGGCSARFQCLRHASALIPLSMENY